MFSNNCLRLSGRSLNFVDLVKSACPGCTWWVTCGALEKLQICGNDELREKTYAAAGLEPNNELVPNALFVWADCGSSCDCWDVFPKILEAPVPVLPSNDEAPVCGRVVVPEFPNNEPAFPKRDAVWFGAVAVFPKSEFPAGCWPVCWTGCCCCGVEPKRPPPAAGCCCCGVEPKRPPPAAGCCCCGVEPKRPPPVAGCCCCGVEPKRLPPAAGCCCCGVEPKRPPPVAGCCCCWVAAFPNKLFPAVDWLVSAFPSRLPLVAGCCWLPNKPVVDWDGVLALPNKLFVTAGCCCCWFCWFCWPKRPPPICWFCELGVPRAGALAKELVWVLFVVPPKSGFAGLPCGFRADTTPNVLEDYKVKIQVSVNPDVTVLTP